MATDDFNRADSATVGNGWTETQADVWSITSNKLRAVGDGPESYDQFCLASSTFDVDDGVVQVDFNASVSGAFPQLGFRLTSGASLTGYICYINESNGRFGYGTINGATYTELAGQTLGAGQLTTGTNYRFIVTLSGSNIDLELYDVDAATTKSTLSDVDSTYSGVGTGVTVNTGTVDFDDFITTPTASGPTISGTSNERAGETVTITVDDSTGVTSATYGGIALTSVATPTGTTVTGVMPIGGLALGSSNNFVVNNGADSNAFAATYLPRTGYSYFTTTANASAFDTESPLYNNSMVTGDQVEYEIALDPTTSVTITSWDAATGLPTLSASISIDNTSSYYIWDASDTYSVGTVGTFNWNETVNPTISSATIDASGDTVTITPSEDVTAGVSGWDDFTLTGLSGGAVTLTRSGGTNPIIYATSRTINNLASEGNGSLAYTKPADGIQDTSNLNNTLETFSGTTVTNNSAQGSVDTGHIYASSNFTFTVRI